MRPVELSRRLVLEAPVRQGDGAGGHTLAWEALGVVWGDMRAVGGGREGARGGLRLSRQRFGVILRAAPPGSASRPRAGQRLRWGARILPIEAVAEWDAAARFLICHVHEEVTP
ncbi:head-tail adaptor protein [Brevirhabdus sp.]|uniref:head-tail adaptor protein n=1 Tax=Brevirhabdus sp. TaxID=2004514 RepID=UPI0040593821